jgi:3-methyladenine DNA glycosylase Tag
MLVSRALAWLLMVNREAFSGFNVDEVAQYTEKQMSSLRADFGLDLATVRGVVNNACRILEVLQQIARARLPTYFFTSS